MPDEGRPDGARYDAERAGDLRERLTGLVVHCSHFDLRIGEPDPSARAVPLQDAGHRAGADAICLGQLSSEGSVSVALDQLELLSSRQPNLGEPWRVRDGFGRKRPDLR